MFKKITIAAALAIVSSAAMAADAPHFYAGADIGKTKLGPFREPGFGFFAGYQFNQQIAVEAGLRRLAHNLPAEIHGVSSGVLRGTAGEDQLAVSAVGTLPLGNGFSAFGRLGVNLVRMSIKSHGGEFSGHDNDVRGLYGIGVAYSFSPAISARMELQKPASDLTNLSAGVSYSF